MIYEYLNGDVEDSLRLYYAVNKPPNDNPVGSRSVEALFAVLQEHKSGKESGEAWVEIVGYWQSGQFQEQIASEITELLAGKCNVNMTSLTFLVTQWTDMLCDLVKDIRSGVPRRTPESDRELSTHARRNLFFETPSDFLDGFADSDVMRRVGACLNCCSNPKNARRFEKQLRDLCQNDPEEVVKDMAKRALRHCLDSKS